MKDSLCSPKRCLDWALTYMSFASKEVTSCYYRGVTRGFIFFAMVALLAAPVIGEACSVPVFRYALERWPADRCSGLVFVLVESGKKEADEAAARLIAEQIPVLEKTVKVSKVLEDDPLVEGPTLKSKLPVKLEMSLLRVSASDERERMFVRMLRRSQS